MNAKVALQYLLPHRLLSRIVRWASRWTWRPWKNFLIGQVMQRYQIDMLEAAQPDAFAFVHFNAFFTRQLKAAARPLASDPAIALCPADGRISQAGKLTGGRLLQAKGRHFSAAELLADAGLAQTYANGSFATIYLSPRDYHRVHMPLAGKLVETAHVPGRIFSVAPFAVHSIPRLFARNERLVCHFQGHAGSFVVVMVGAMLVSGVQTVWSGEVIPPYASRIVRRDYRDQGIHLARGDEMARFNMGSTVIVLLPGPDQVDPGLKPEQTIRMGQPLGMSLLVPEQPA